MPWTWSGALFHLSAADTAARVLLTSSSPISHACKGAATRRPLQAAEPLSPDPCNLTAHAASAA
ncbi:uncharacterized protein K452DRAFT_282756 [Aplosporella prunicola CBS 121167]|uniref:Uncharacterized protein n=1 Tax=Aplosporella prunicola CBS 121167 TaxID=1176127 RepID=A0A6A6BUU6_9PEZI|nr:uncharacterized protein K452DRAFT_282756 [Aplosporella prunicola CBS 121167]KAF2146577.1 hypothetical protein K452DRAFT_282756 [Aplosporella prunicola CBS 121167]